MVPLVTLVMLDLEENPDRSDQRETMEDLASATLGQEDHRGRGERTAVLGLAAAEETVVKRVTRGKKELWEREVSQDPRVSQA